ncbi:LysR family transcriptional regulator [Rhizobium lentis]|uniref:LysR family transcriptional regulator n=1 Tax=Rhizobium lentis TaxID=1138194 RepID=A0A9Q3M669_9HYPH|nr:LysR family transcriptional regulator [Rhizobium lentis]MBX5012737.1 LysR family transcriptional regulator [Rhizobium lentis]MBX5022478.1 LysR family transcriptional regulator [Rhizobium lentis]MBX5029812.1 LysR family transcriptional regulator [Rhizobium lentis]MBX5036483.1 LysR family transcriptional regulator [Rhizobium lentis]MBX5042583.1 LysR family transcriptional regulator [Rhizobium lentis]
MRGMPPLKALRVFEACIRLGTFTAAARELNVGQPAISHQIQALEKDLGLTLFERNGGVINPTAEALAYHARIASALTDIAMATRSLRERASGPSLTLGTYPGLAMFWLMPKLANLRSSDSELSVRVVTAERDEHISLDSVDCAILFGDGRWNGMEARMLIPEVVVPVAAPSVAAKLASLSREDIFGQGPLIHLEDPERRWFNWDDWKSHRARNATVASAGINVSNHGIAIHEALMGHGVTLGWRGVIDDLVSNGLLVEMDDEPLTSERGYYLVGPGDFIKSRLGTELLTALTAEVSLVSPK